MSDAPNAYFDENGVAIFRASAIGSCEAALVHSLRGVEAQEPPEDMMRRFADGHLHEPAIIAHLIKAGWQVLQDKGQETVRVAVSDGIIFQGHVDGIAIRDGKHYVVECKSMSDAMFKKWVSGGFAEFPKYAMQISIYMAALNMPALYAVKNKNSGEIEWSIIEKPPYLLAKLKAKAIRVVKTAATGKTPDCPKHFDYPCPFYPMHPNRKENSPVPVEVKDEDIAELDLICADFEAAKAQKAHWTERYDELKAKILEVVGEQETVATAAYEVKVKTVKQRRLNMDLLRAAHPDLSQFERMSTSTWPEVKARTSE